uniref:Tyrosyl-DNA phosphodiesterase n=1 Tax=Globodera pallida TaxID=36090 RepID=A0A183C2V1_GLOPA
MKRQFVEEKCVDNGNTPPTAPEGKMSKSGDVDVQNTLAEPNSSDLMDGGVHLVKVECLGTEANNSKGNVPRALSLFELIRAIRPIASIHFNYCIDPQWVLRQYSRRLRECPIAFVVGHQQLQALRAAVPSAFAASVRCAGVPMPFAYGTHHAKLSLFEANDRALHVVISTANLVEEDWTAKTQAFYHARGKLDTDGVESGAGTASTSVANDADANTSSAPHQRFRDDLVAYLRAAYPAGAGGVHQMVQFWVDRIGQADFSHIPDRIVASVPGRYQKSAVGAMCRFGHLRLRQLLSEAFSAEERGRHHKTFVGQFSSIGSLGARPEAWLCDEFLTSLSGGKSMLSASALKLIYPTVENVRDSLEGYAAGLSLPYSSQTHRKQPYLKQFLHHYVALDSAGQCQWLLLTSANLSHSAWGKLEKGCTQMFVRSFELGVLMCAKDHQRSALFPPFDLPLTKYAADDEPFVVDMLYTTKPTDANGFRGAMDARTALTG